MSGDVFSISLSCVMHLQWLGPFLGFTDVQIDSIKRQEHPGDR